MPFYWVEWHLSGETLFYSHRDGDRAYKMTKGALIWWLSNRNSRPGFLTNLTSEMAATEMKTIGLCLSSRPTRVLCVCYRHQRKWLRSFHMYSESVLIFQKKIRKIRKVQWLANIPAPINHGAWIHLQILPVEQMSLLIPHWGFSEKQLRHHRQMTPCLGDLPLQPLPLSSHSLPLCVSLCLFSPFLLQGSLTFNLEPTLP